jgi:hypothetical protein
MELKVTDYQAEILRGLLAELIADKSDRYGDDFKYAVLQPMYDQLVKEN